MDYTISMKKQKQLYLGFNMTKIYMKANITIDSESDFMKLVNSLHNMKGVILGEYSLNKIKMDGSKK